MSNSFNHSNLGDQFKKAVSEGLATGDFRELNILVNDTVTEAISEAGRQVKNVSNTNYRSTTKIYENARQYEKQQQKRNEQYKKMYQSSGQLKNGSPTKSKNTLPATKTKSVGQVSSILYMVFGGIGTGISTALLLASTIIGLVSGSWSISLLGFLGALLGGSIFMVRKGINEKNRLERMKRYLSLFAGKMYVNIADLADSLGKSTKYILKDVKKMMKLGFFPEGHLDKKETCLMLDDATYREYLRLEKERKTYELEHGSTPTNTSNTSNSGNSADSPSRKQEPTASVNTTHVNPELNAMIQEGQAYIRKLHELNDIIPEEVISEKMDRMEGLLKEIFKRLEEDPTQMSQMHKLMNYYLPTTIKLLQSYSEFDDISAPGTDIIKAKAEIEKTVDIINEAFTELLNKLFQATVFDVTTDAQVLQTMLAKEGLTKNDFSEDKK